MKLTAKQFKTLNAICCLDDSSYKTTVYLLADILFGERYGIYATRAQGRVQTLKRMGLVSNEKGFIGLTPAGRAALAGMEDQK